MGFSHSYGPAVHEEQAVAAIREAYEMGYRFFDTAAVYRGFDDEGNESINEVLVGKALHDVRDQVVIASKYGVEHGEGGLITDGSIENLRKSLDQTLKNLDTDYLDLFYLHQVDPNVDLEEIAKEMKRLIEAGKIKGWGISEATIEQIEKANAICPLAAIQNRFSMMARWYEPTIEKCAELGITFVAFSPLANGFLSNSHPQTFDAKTDYRAKMPQYEPSVQEQMQSLLDKLNAIAAKYNCTLAQLSLAWMCALHDNLIPIPGSTKVSRIKENFDATKIDLSKEDLGQINALLEEAGDLPVFGGSKIIK